jgi:CHASE3 domain sensor protein
MAHWTFGYKIAAGFALVVAFAVAIGATAYVALAAVVSAKDAVIGQDADALILVERIRAARESKGSDARGFLLSRNERDLAEMQSARSRLLAALDALQDAVVTDESRRLVDELRVREAEHQRAMDGVTALRRTDAPIEAVVSAFDERVTPARDRLDDTLNALVARQRQRLESATLASTEAAATASATVAVMLVLLSLAAAGAAVLITRALNRQIGSAVSQVQGSSTELQAAATQQATAAKEQATAMSEIATTISELLATSRQITESAQHVARIADQTAGAARSGEQTVEQAHDSIAGIRKQMDHVVGHMLDLGQQSQQIGSVLEIVSELAEQTNILAINATIEAAGAGEAGRRFAVVADEIRKLADRVAASTKEIRGLIDGVRSAVNTTVMATEAGSKAVDGGSKQFAQVASSFKAIATQVGTTFEAAREIELSIKQQMTAVEQVNVAIASIAQASRETEASTGQTLQTAGQLASLSRDLLRVIEPDRAA